MKYSMNWVQKRGNDEMPEWKRLQRRIVKECVTNTGGVNLWKFPRTGLRIPDHAFLAMNNHGKS